MLQIENTTETQIDTKSLEEIVLKLTEKDVELIFVNNSDIQELNSEHRGFDEPTDVLSFQLEPLPHLPLGSIVVSLEYADVKAKELGHALNNEVALLFIHGLLHLLGYNHENDNGEMREKEREIIEEFGLPNSLIIRNT